MTPAIRYPLRWSTAALYASAAGLFLLALGARLLIAPVEGGLAFVTFYPAILIGFYLLGTGPGAALALVSGATAAYAFLPPYMVWAFDATGWRNIAFFTLTCSLAAWIVGSLHRSERRLHDALTALQAERDSLERQVAERTADLASARDAAQSADLAKSTFLANMSHEIRTPVNAIVGLAHLIKRAGVSHEQGARLDKIHVAGRHLIDLISAILDLSKIEKGEFRLDEEVVDLRRVAGDVRSILASAALAKQLRLELDLGQAPSTLFLGDRIRLQQALLNYGANAIKFTAAGSVVIAVRVVEDAPDAALLRFEVRDTGIGIEPRVLPRLFNAFEQADASIARAYGGSGLGLAITRRLARNMGGDAGADSSVGHGSSFWFTARLRKAPAGAVTKRPPIADATEEALLRDFADRRLLLVEDDPVNREIALELLRGIWPAVDEAADGYEALAAVERQAYDLIVMDMQMPGMSGPEATRRIRAMANGRRVAIVGLSANAFVEDREQCFEAGMDDFLAKPVDPATLYACLHTWLSKAG